MKTILTFLILSISSNLFCQFTTEDFTAIKKNLKGGFFKGAGGYYDKIQKIYWIESKSYTTGSTKNISMNFYFGLEKKDGKLTKLPTRVKLKYISSSWLFIDELSFSYAILKDTDNLDKASVTQTISSPVRDVLSGGTISEKIDEVLTFDMHTFIKDIIDNPRWLDCRISGDSSYEHFVITKRYLKKKYKFFFEIEKLYSNL